MRTIGFGVIVAAAVSCGAAALAAGSTSGPAPGAPDPNEIICKDAAAETGSTLGHRRICMTRLQWQQQNQDDRDEVNRAQLRSLDTAVPGH